MSSPSFLVRLRTRRRPDGELRLQLPEDHWHAGDPRMVEGALALQAEGVPHPRRALSAVPEVDVRDGVVDLRAEPTPPLAVLRPRTAQMPAVAPAGPAGAAGTPQTSPVAAHACTETSTWLG